MNHFDDLLHCSEFFMPGMVDTHIHAPQYSYAGTGLDMTLLQWLSTYTFPAESRFENLKFANRVYTEVVVSMGRSILSTAIVCLKHVCELKTLVLMRLREVTPTLLSANQLF